MFIKVASIIEILIGLAIAGYGGFIFLAGGVASGPMAIVSIVIGVPIIFFGIFLIILGINLWKFKKWARLTSKIIFIIVILSIIVWILK